MAVLFRLQAAIVLSCIALVSSSGVSTQYHAQDGIGQYSYGYSGGPSAKTETKTADGVVRGGYSYVDGHGLVQSASYVADPHNGFRVAATNLPVAPAAPAPAPLPVAPVVKAAPVIPAAPLVPAAPLPVYKAATYAPLAPYVAAPAPLPVYGWPAGVETPEVTLAKHAHIQAVHEQKALIHSWRRKRSAPLAYAAYPYAYTVPKGFAYSSVTHHGYTPAHYPYAAAYTPAYTPAATYPLAHATPLAHVAAPHVPLDTPEVAAAKAAHFAAVHEAKARVYAAPHAYPAAPHVYSHAAPLPLPVTDTPEVAHAKAAHLAAVSAAKYSAYHH